MSDNDEKEQGDMTVVTGVIGIEDPHVIGHKVLSYALKQEGFNVVALGAKCAPEEFIEAAIETDANAILVGSIAGHAELNCRGFREMCQEAGLNDILLYVGGNVAPANRDWKDVEATFRQDLGFDRVYPPRADVQTVAEDLRQDITRQRAGS